MNATTTVAFSDIVWKEDDCRFFDADDRFPSDWPVAMLAESTQPARSSLADSSDSEQTNEPGERKGKRPRKHNATNHLTTAAGRLPGET